MIIKVCGVTTPEDAAVVAEAGVDLVGLNFHPASPRFVSLKVAAELARVAREAAPRVQIVGVFVDATEAVIGEAVTAVGLDMVQLHGAEAPAWCQALSWPWMKAHRLRAAADVERVRDWFPGGEPALFLADAWHPTLAGGTGRVLDEELARSAAALGPMILAGGLTPDNVAAAVQAVRPAGVDVASGVESAPGRKDPGAVRAFVAAARG